MKELANNQLRKIRIKGFKTIRECDLDLGRINILIGSNGAGKSNFISVFEMLQSVLSQDLSLYVGVKGRNSLFCKGTKVTNAIETEVYFGNNSYGFKLIPSSGSGVTFADEYFGYEGTRTTISKGQTESLWRNGCGNKISDYVIPILEAQNWRVYHFHDTGAQARVKQEHNIVNSASLMGDAGNLAAYLLRLKTNYPKSYNKIISTINFVAPYFDDFVLEPNEYNKDLIILKWKQRGIDDVFTANQMSDGTLRFACLATLLLQPKELMPATIIIDEPELGLHSFAITLLAEMMQSAAISKQLIVSTQSAQLLDCFDAEDVIVVDRENDETVFSRLDAKKLKVWLDDDYTLGELWQRNALGV